MQQQYVEPEPDMTNYMEWHSTDQNNEFKYAETPPNTNGEEKNGKHTKHTIKLEPSNCRYTK